MQPAVSGRRRALPVAERVIEMKIMSAPPTLHYCMQAVWRQRRTEEWVVAARDVVDSGPVHAPSTDDKIYLEGRGPACGRRPRRAAVSCDDIDSSLSPSRTKDFCHRPDCIAPVWRPPPATCSAATSLPSGDSEAPRTSGVAVRSSPAPEM